MNAEIKDRLLRLILTKSFKPYLVILGFNLALILLAVFTNSGPIGMIFGSSLGAIYPKTNPLYFIAVVLIYFIRRPLVAIGVATIFSFIYQAFFVGDLNEFRQIAGLPKLGYLDLPKIYGGILLLSVMGLFHFVIARVSKKLTV